jgi:hypothetical protein
MKHKMIRHEFVDLIPDVIDEGVLYISITYATATHRCGCGCGEIVVTPIEPTWWTLIWNGKTVTMDPSIGSWSLPCKSHYWIKENEIVWARKWDDLEIKGGSTRDRITKTLCYRKLQKWFRRT